VKADKRLHAKNMLALLTSLETIQYFGSLTKALLTQGACSVRVQSQLVMALGRKHWF